MDFGKFDMVLLTTMSLSIILMSITFPALGLTDSSDQQGESDVPEFNISSSEWDIAGDFPTSPGTPTRGQVRYVEENGASVTGQSLIWLERGTPGQSLEMQNISTQLTLRVNSWCDDGSGGSQICGQDEYAINEEGQEFLHQNETSGYNIQFTVTELENAQRSNMTSTVEYDILEAPEGSGGFFESIPVIGGLFNTGEQLVSGLVWIGSVIWWFIAFSFEIALAVVGTLFSVVQYGVNMLVWLTTTYTAVVSAAGGFGSAILMMPAILLFLEFAKIGMLGIKLLPFT